MDITIINVLKEINENGYSAYIVGGYVRDNFLNKSSFDVDIATSATPKELLTIFPSSKIVEGYGAVKLTKDKYNFDITTYRKEEKYVMGAPKGITYVKTLEEDLKRRDFTINAICLDKNFNIIDPLNGKEDLNNKIIKVIGNTETKFKEDPSRILRAIRFSLTLNFTLSEDIIDFLVNNKEWIEKINYSKKKYELEKIFLSDSAFEFVNFIKKYELEGVLGIKVKKLIPSKSLVGMWAQIDFDPKYSFTKIELSQIEEIRKLVEKGNIDKYDIYKYGTYIASNAALILGKKTKTINKLYEKLPIKDIIDIDIDSETICDILNIEPSKMLGDTYKILEQEIIDYKLVNKRENIIKRLEKLKGEL